MGISLSTLTAFPFCGSHSISCLTEIANPDAILEKSMDILTGTISDFDADGLFGLIDADDGRLIFFNLRDVGLPARDLFKVGTRVEFAAQIEELAPRAWALKPASTRV